MNAITGRPIATACAQEPSIDPVRVSHDHSLCTWLSAGRLIRLTLVALGERDPSGRRKGAGVTARCRSRNMLTC
ncbi:hypothetical protein L3i22_055410 [Actinoplanes sp. L3-i22]|nr:hypothetical protein L3i22_055410 [Actinoplanes sp. L3-i22]